MKFSKVKTLLKKGQKKEKELDSNPVNDLVHALTPERKDRSPAAEEPEEGLSDLEEKKRKRYEEIMKKYR